MPNRTGVLVRVGLGKLVAYTAATVLVHALIAVVTASPSFFYGVKDLTSHHRFFFQYASRFLGGEVPYRDYTIEYPILAFATFLLPRLVTSGFRPYQFAFGLEMLLFDAATVYLVALRVAREEGDERVPSRLFWYTAFFGSMCPLVIGRYDLAPTALAFAAALWWSSGRNALGGVAAGLGVLLKIFPGAVAAPALVREMADWRKSRLRGMIAFLTTVTVGAVLWLTVGGRGVFDSFRYHGGRGLEFESLYAGAIFLYGLASGQKVTCVYDHFSFHITPEWGARVVPWVPFVQAAALLLVMWRFWRAGMTDGVRYAGAAILALIITGKILSAQFLIWLFPFVAAARGRLGLRSRRIFLPCCIITTLIYPIGFMSQILKNDAASVLLLNYRNAMLLYLLLLLLYGRDR
jgi:hypothetical protein